MAKRKAGSQIGNLTPDHKKLGIDPTPMRAGAVGHTVGKLLMSYNFASDLVPIQGLSEKL
jgi:hypothetical protein